MGWLGPIYVKPKSHTPALPTGMVSAVPPPPPEKPSLQAKAVLFALHTIGFVCGLYLLFWALGADPRHQWYHLIGPGFVPARAQLLIVAAIIYWTRHSVLLAKLDNCKLPFTEAACVGAFLMLLHPGLAFLGLGGVWPASETHWLHSIGPTDGLGAASLVAGIALSSVSLVRKDTHWVHSLGPNTVLVGEALTFAGWVGLLTATFWMLWLPLLILFLGRAQILGERKQAKPGLETRASTHLGLF